MDILSLSEHEYNLVCLVLEEPPMPRRDLIRLTSLRLFLKPKEAEALLSGLLSRDILTAENGTILSRVTREEADMAALHRVLNTFTPRWPAPNPPPEKIPAETPAGKSRPRRKLLPRLIPLLLLALAGAAVWFFLLREHYPKLVTFEDGRTFSLRVKPESEVQRAAAEYLEHYTEAQSWFGKPLFSHLELSDMTEFATDGAWATQVDTSALYLPTSGYDIAAEHKGVVIFADADVTYTEDAPAAETDGPRFFRLYLSETEEGWTVDTMESTRKSDGFFVSGEDVTVDGRTFTVSQWGRTLTGGTRQIYAVTASDGEKHRMLFLTEQPVQQSSQLSPTFYDLNGDGHEDVMFFGNYRLCYLYSPEEHDFRLAPLLSGQWLQYDPALPGTVQLSRSVEGTTTQYFYRIADGDTLVELARMDIATTFNEGSDITHTYTYYENGQTTGVYGLNLSTTEEITDDFSYALAYLEPTLRWDEAILRTARQAGCLELPLPVTTSTSVTGNGIQLIYKDITENLTVYTSPNGFLLVRDGQGDHILPGTPHASRVIDYDGDGDSDILTTINDTGGPAVLLNTGSGWSVQELDLTFISEEFNQNTHITYSEADTGKTGTIAYSGRYGTTSCTFPAEFYSDYSPNSVEIFPGICSVQSVQSLGDERRVTFSFPILFMQDGVWQATDAAFYCEVTLTSSSGDAWTLFSLHITRQSLG